MTISQRVERILLLQNSCSANKKPRCLAGDFAFRATIFSRAIHAVGNCSPCNS
jgi:hypothetical protein